MSKSIAVLGSDQVPLAYTVPVPGSLTPLSASAVYDGSGAGSFQPALSFYDNDGNLIVRQIGPTVAAGGSVEQSWFPRVAAQTSGTPTGFAASWIHLHDISITVPSSSTSTIYDFTAAAVYTNDATTFTVVAGNGVTINAPGFYVATISCDWQGATAAAPCEMTWNLDPLDNGMFDQDVFNKPGFAAGVAVTQGTQGFPVDPGSVGTASPLALRQTTGSNAGVSMEAMVIRLTADYGNF